MSSITTILNPMAYLAEPIGHEYAVIVLNQPIEIPCFDALWENARFRIAADGAINKIASLGDKVYVIGDFDSVNKEQTNSPLIEMIYEPCQDRTDFQKSLHWLVEDCKFDGPVFAVGAIDGRFDHTAMALNTLYLFRSVRMYLLNKSSLVTLLGPGCYEFITLAYDASTTCGLIPFPNSCVVTTNGLKWDLSEATLELGSTISTSNLIINANSICIKIHKGYCIWTIENPFSRNTSAN